MKTMSLKIILALVMALFFYSVINADSSDYITGTIYDLKTEKAVKKTKRYTGVTGVSKAIIVAGGGAYMGNALWPVTEKLSSLAYNTLIYRGYSAERIFFLTADNADDLLVTDALEGV